MKEKGAEKRLEKAPGDWPDMRKGQSCKVYMGNYWASAEFLRIRNNIAMVNVCRAGSRNPTLAMIYDARNIKPSS
jgi:hypothetical protein